jgi:hypothetical protein
MRDFYCAIRSVFRYPGYLPQPLAIGRVLRWIWQFRRRDRKYIRRLLKSVVYLSEETVRDVLLEQNEALMQRLASAGLNPTQLIYIQVHDAGSSSPVMLNLLRDAAHLEQRGCAFLDSQNTLGIADMTNDLGQGALIYVDDFVGSGQQLCEARDFAIQYVVGTFAEFVLVPSICEEGREMLEGKGIEVFSGHIHMKSERPLHRDSTLFEAVAKRRLQEICNDIDQQVALGFRNMAVMVVLYRNAPDNVPVLLRGNINQTPYIGIFPRTTDMPI